MTELAVRDGDSPGRGPIKRFASVRNGYAFREGVTDDPQGDTRVLQLRDVDEDGEVDIESLPQVAFGYRAARHVLHAGDVLMASRGGKSMAFVAEFDAPVVASAGLLVIRPDYALDSAYLRWFLNHPNTQRRLKALREGSNLQFIDKGALESLRIPVPDIYTQRKIAGLTADHQRRVALRLRLSELEAQLLDATTWQLASPEHARIDLSGTWKTNIRE